MASSTQSNHPPAPRSRPRVRRRGAGWALLLAFLLVIAALLAVGDRVAAKVATDELHSRVAQELAARDVGYSSLAVEMGGTPFLTQVATSDFEKITIDLSQVNLPTSDGGSATLPQLHVVADGVHADAVAVYQGTGSVTADRVAGTAVISYQTLADRLDLSQYQVAGVRLANITFTETAGTLQARVEVQALGLAAPVVATAEVNVVNGRLEVRLRDARAVGVTLPQSALGPLSQLANYVLVANLPALPFGLVLDRMDVVGDGLLVGITGHQIELVHADLPA